MNSALARMASSWFTKRCLRAWAMVQNTTRRTGVQRRVPVMLQLNDVECSAACLAMVLTYYGRPMSVAECRETCGVGRDGVTARAIAEAARQYGLRVRAFSGEVADLRHVQLPAIIHWNFDHFVVVERCSSRWIEIVDPAVGRRRLTIDEFSAGFTGVLLTLEPGVHFQRQRATRRSALRRYLTYAAQIPGTLSVAAQILFASLLLQAFALAIPLFTQVLIDHILPSGATNILTTLGLSIAILTLAQAATIYLRAALVIVVQARIDTRLMLGFFEHLLALPFRFFQQRTSGDLLMRLGSTSLIRELLTNQAVSAVLDGMLALVTLTILLVRAPMFGALALGIGMLQVALLLATARRMHDLTQRDLATQAESQGYLVEALSGIATLKASGTESRALDYWSNLFWQQLNASLQRDQLSALVDTGMTVLRACSPLILLWFGAFQVLQGTVSLGTMLALNALAVLFLTPLATLVANAQQLQLVGAHLDRIVDVLQAEPEQHLPVATPRLTGRIELKQVSFRYSRDAPLVLRDISLMIEPGQKVALVGRTGSGKSTLAMLLLGLYAPAGGEILYDGIPASQIDPRALRSQFGVVLQEPFLLSGSIRHNIGFNAPDLPLAQIIMAAQFAAIHDEIMQMPMGYETRVGEGGGNLSGGQRQRLAIARALAHDPAFLILDEATSQLDVVTEAAVDWYLSQLACTRIVLAHRLSTIRNADLILVLDEGTLVERGSHDELLAQGGQYAALIHSQSVGSATEEQLFERS